jgi:hypothetical protein
VTVAPPAQPTTATVAAPVQPTTTPVAPPVQTSTKVATLVQQASPVISTVTQITTTVGGALVTRTYTTSTSVPITPTAEPVVISKHKSLSGGAIGGIAGGAVGGIFLLLLLAALGFIRYRNRKRRESDVIEAYDTPVNHYAQPNMAGATNEVYQKHLSSSTATEMPADYRSYQQSPVYPSSGEPQYHELNTNGPIEAPSQNHYPVYNDTHH